MTQRFIVTGTDTGIGKTVFSAAIAGALDASYWKPIQSGLDDATDSETVAHLAGLPPTKIIPEVYRLAMPASPHRAAEAEGTEISISRLTLPKVEGPLVVEGAGGLMVPITREFLQIDLFRSFRLPVILVARTALGTINHSLLSIEALCGRNIPIQGIAFVGEEVPDTERTICEMGNVKRLGRLPHLPVLTPATLARVFSDNFRLEDFT